MRVVEERRLPELHESSECPLNGQAMHLEEMPFQKAKLDVESHPMLNILTSK
jgi:hypothetical protein